MPEHILTDATLDGNVKQKRRELDVEQEEPEKGTDGIITESCQRKAHLLY
jgi:hypothetical protein